MSTKKQKQQKHLYCLSSSKSIQRGFIVFMERPTAFGTYKAIKIELVAG